MFSVWGDYLLPKLDWCLLPVLRIRNFRVTWVALWLCAVRKHNSENLVAIGKKPEASSREPSQGAGQVSSHLYWLPLEWILAFGSRRWKPQWLQSSPSRAAHCHFCSIPLAEVEAISLLPTLECWTYRPLHHSAGVWCWELNPGFSAC